MQKETDFTVGRWCNRWFCENRGRWSGSTVGGYRNLIYRHILPGIGGVPLTDRLRAGERSQALFRQLGQYGVSLYDQHYQALRSAGDLEELEDGTAVLANLSLYSRETGLSLDADFGKGLFV